MILADRALALLGTWGLPADRPATLAFGCAVALALAASVRSVPRAALYGTAPNKNRSTAVFLACTSLAAALLSVGYVEHYLRGGPRIIDATSYFWQGRALSRGGFTWTPLEPSASFRGRFFIYREDGLGHPLMGGIFPPGYPLVLALGFLLGAPMFVGPALAALLVLATYALAKTLSERVLAEHAEPIARSAALLSVVCAALRYHTADTMSHGASALYITVALTCALRMNPSSARRQGEGYTMLAGIALGLLIATRPVSAMAIGLVVLSLIMQRGGTTHAVRRVAVLVVAALPGVFLLAASQRAVSGSWFASTQRLYYALSDGPPGCFRWGFGKGIGCVFEHGAFVASRLPSGYGLLEAAGTTLRRLREHSLDIGNVEPLALLWLAPVLVRRARPAAWHATLAVILHVVAYVPFYFDGDYPGGGARFFADVLPIEHALTALGLAIIVHSTFILQKSVFGHWAMGLISLSLLGFAFHGSFEHGKLRDRDGGRPMFETSVLARAGITQGLVFVDTDHGFSLGHDPRARVDEGVVVARRRDDDRDRLIYESLGRPRTWHYRFDPSTNGPSPSEPALTPFVPPESSTALRFEAEAEWPALEQHGGFAIPAWSSDCVSQKRALVVTPSSNDPASITITLPVPRPGHYELTPVIAPDTELPVSHIQRRQAGPSSGAMSIAAKRWTWRATATCTTLPPRELELEPPRVKVTIEAFGGPVAIDAFLLRPLPAQ